MRALAVVVAIVVAIVVYGFVGWNALIAIGPHLGGIPSLPAINGGPSFQGAATTPHPVRAARIPQNPFLAGNGRSSIHVDAYMSDTNTGSGPLGDRISASSTWQVGECATLTFDSRGRIISLCVRPVGRFLVMLEPDTLDRVATFALPDREGGLPALIGAGSGALTDFSGGGYFYLDDHDRAVVPTTTEHVYVIAQTEDPGFRLVRDIDLNDVLGDGDAIISVLPDWEGRLWFVTSDGVVGVIPRGAGAPLTDDLGESIDNSFAVDETGGVFIVTDKAMYRFDAGRHDQPRVSWRQRYPNSGVTKPGQGGAGSGTTPTLLGRQWVGITDNAEHMGVVVYRRQQHVRGSRLVCRQPVFEPGRSATENSLIAAGRSFLVENNYGYGGPASTVLGGTAEPGFTRVEIDRDERGCATKWESDVRAPSVVPKLSLANGLVYTYTKPAGATSEPWYLTALDYRTGHTVWKALAGRGFSFNNHYAPVTIGPDGSAYVGVVGGIVRLADGA